MYLNVNLCLLFSVQNSTNWTILFVFNELLRLYKERLKLFSSAEVCANVNKRTKFTTSMKTWE